MQDALVIGQLASDAIQVGNVEHVVDSAGTRVRELYESQDWGLHWRGISKREDQLQAEIKQPEEPDLVPYIFRRAFKQATTPEQISEVRWQWMYYCVIAPWLCEFDEPKEEDALAHLVEDPDNSFFQQLVEGQDDEDDNSWIVDALLQDWTNTGMPWDSIRARLTDWDINQEEWEDKNYETRLRGSQATRRGRRRRLNCDILVERISQIKDGSTYFRVSDRLRKVYLKDQQWRSAFKEFLAKGFPMDAKDLKGQNKYRHTAWDATIMQQKREPWYTGKQWYRVQQEFFQARRRVRWYRYFKPQIHRATTKAQVIHIMARAKQVMTNGEWQSEAYGILYQDATRKYRSL